MRYIFPLLLPLLLLVTGCKTNYKVTDAMKQEWFGGAAGSGGGVRYKVFIKKPSKVEVGVSQVWVGDREKGQFVPFRFFNDSAKTTTMMVDPGVELFRVEFDERIQGQRPPNMEIENPEKLQDDAPSDLPEGFQKGAVIYLKDGAGKVSMLAVEDFKRLEPLAYP